MTAQQALDLLSPIPKEDFITRTYADSTTQCCCSTGHLVRLRSENPESYDSAACSFVLTEDEAVENLVEKSREFLGCGHSIVTVNDGFAPQYLEDNPKDRVIHLLTDMIKAGY